MQRMQIVGTQLTRLPLYFRGHWRDSGGADLRARLQRADGGRGDGARAAHVRHLQVRGQRGGAEEPQEEEAQRMHRGVVSGRVRVVN